MDFKNFFKNNLSFGQEKKQKIMMIILIVVLLVIVFVVYFGITNSSKYNNPSDSIVKDDSLYLINKTIDEVDFDVNFLDYLEDFEIYGIRPSEETKKGTTNPFLQD